MKKIIITIAALAAFALSASAQWYVGGTAGLSINAPKNESTVFGLTIAPEGGYAFNDKMSVGAMIELTSSSADKISDTNFRVSPYFRYTFLQVGALNFFADGILSIGSETIKNSEYDKSASGTAWGINIAPGFRINAIGNLDIVSRFITFGYNGTKAGGESAGEFAFQILTGPTIGVQYNF